MDPQNFPTEDQIRKACKEIQSRWNDDEKIARRRCSPEVFIVPETVREAAWSALDEKLRRKRSRMQNR